jgi:hypothetical protein
VHELTIVNLGKRLEGIGEESFRECTSLRDIIIIPPAVKAINDKSFLGCSQMTSVILGEGLEKIGEGAFEECTSLHDIIIPPVVKAISSQTFFNCSLFLVTIKDIV